MQNNYKPTITKFSWNLVDKPWDFYSICYELDNYMEHMLYIPAKIIEEELQTKTIVEIVCSRLHASLKCTPVHIDRITKEMRSAAHRSTKFASRGRKKSKLAQSRLGNG